MQWLKKWFEQWADWDWYKLDSSGSSFSCTTRRWPATFKCENKPYEMFNQLGKNNISYQHLDQTLSIPINLLGFLWTMKTWCFIIFVVFLYNRFFFTILDRQWNHRLEPFPIVKLSSLPDCRPRRIRRSARWSSGSGAPNCKARRSR